MVKDLKECKDTIKQYEIMPLADKTLPITERIEHCCKSVLGTTVYIVGMETGKIISIKEIGNSKKIPRMAKLLTKQILEELQSTK